eukprot:Platyproteum_vivax@DN4360_c0_g1_i2.p1
MAGRGAHRLVPAWKENSPPSLDSNLAKSPPIDSSPNFTANPPHDYAKTSNNLAQIFSSPNFLAPKMPNNLAKPPRVESSPNNLANGPKTCKCTEAERVFLDAFYVLIDERGVGLRAPLHTPLNPFVPPFVPNAKKKNKKNKNLSLLAIPPAMLASSCSTEANLSDTFKNSVCVTNMGPVLATPCTSNDTQAGEKKKKKNKKKKKKKAQDQGKEAS